MSESMTEILNKLKEKHDITATETPSDYQKQRIEWYNNSEGHLHEADGYNCSLCKNRGYSLEVDENGYEYYVNCKCQKVRATLKRAARSGLGNIITEYTFDKYEDTEPWQTEIKNKAKAFCADDMAKWFYIGGQVGAGKTHICTGIAAHYIKAGREVKYMLWAEEAKKLKALVNDEGYQEEISIYKNIDVLYIDDFLKVKSGETPTTADLNLAFEIINHRLLDGDKVTIISSEKMLDEIMDYDEATMSRIFQKTGQYKFNIPKDRAKNYRLRS